MAIYTQYTDPTVSGIWYGSVTQATTTLYQVSDGTHTANYFGSFRYDIYGNLQGGTISRYSEFDNGVKAYENTSGSWDVSTYFGCLASGDSEAASDYIFRGNDTVYGSGYSEILVPRGGSNLVYGNGGNDSIYGGDTGNDTFYGGIGDDELIGGTGADRIFGGDGNDVLGGYLGNDYLDGGTGDADIASYINPTSSVIIDLEAGTAIGGYGTDSLLNIEGVRGTENYGDVLKGSSYANWLYGNGGNDVLEGRAGLDWLDGGAGNDTVDGGTESDSLFGGQGDDSILGGSGNDLLDGAEGADSLAGGAGTDTMNGGLGSDIYIVDNIGDRVTEIAGQGIDLIKSEITYSLVDTDGAGADGGNVEKLTLTGTIAINGTGNGLVNILTGNSAVNVLKGLAGKDTLIGAGGNDKLYGGTGNDALTGGIGADWFVFDTTSNVASNLDTIKDFVFGIDKIVLDDDFFTLGLTGTSAGVALTASKFQLGTAASDLDDRIIYDQSSGKLYYDADGSGAGAQVQFALLSTGTTHPVLSASDFLVIN